MLLYNHIPGKACGNVRRQTPFLNSIKQFCRLSILPPFFDQDISGCGSH